MRHLTRPTVRYRPSMKKLIRALLDDIRTGPEERVKRRRSMIKRDQLPYDKRPSTTGLLAPVADGRFDGRLRKVS